MTEGDCALVIATHEHEAVFRKRLDSLGIDLPSLERSGKALFVDAERMLARFMVGGRPDWDRFEGTISRAVRSIAPKPGRRVRAYGEMVGILWTSGQYSAAINLEEHWNRFLKGLDASLFCAYPIDIFDPEFEAAGVHAILCDHTHLIPADESGALEKALRRAMRQVLGDQADELESSMGAGCPPQWGVVPRAEHIILWLRTNLPRSAREILPLARAHYRELTSLSPA